MPRAALLSRLAFTAGLLLAPFSAFADWRVASSEHFVIYADDNEKDLYRFSERLERYHSAMSVFFGTQRGAPSPSNRVTVYVVKNDDEVRKLFGDGKDSRFIQGFYIARAGGSLAIIPPVNTSRGGQIGDSERVLLHEYAHHFQHENFSGLASRWFIEGFAEYFSSVKFESDEVRLGMPAEHRAAELQLASNVTIEQLLDAKAYEARKSEQYNNFYGRSWALFHMFFSTVEGRAQLIDYLKRLEAGEAELAAATAAFGDLDALDTTLRAYSRKRSFLAWRMEGSKLQVGEISVGTLNEAEAASMPVRIRSKRGVNKEQAAEVVVLARELAAKYPDEPEVQAVLAEAEFDTGNDEAAIASADLALAKNPNQVNAWIQKGFALTRIAQEGSYPSDWAAARKHFVAANKVEVDHPLPLLYYYRTFVQQGEKPSTAAVEGLHWAVVLAPYDRELRLLSAQQRLKDEQYAAAITALTPLAYDPHNSNPDNIARKLLDEAKEKLAAAPPQPAQ